MKKPICLFALSFLLAALMGCQKSDADILGIVSTDEVENYFGTTVEVSYSDNTKMYFHLLSDTTAEVVNYYRFYTVQEEQSPWIYRGDIVIPDRFVHNGKTYKVTCIGEGAFKASVQNHELVSLVSSVEMPNSIDTIRNWAFSECVHLTSIDIPNSVKYIGDAAFAGSGLTSVVIPSSVNGFGNSVFSSTCLTSVEIPASVNYLGVNPLDDCSSLTTLICRPTTPPEKDPHGQHYEDYFMLGNSIERILVPAQSVDLYKESYFWRLYKDIIVGM